MKYYKVLHHGNRSPFNIFQWSLPQEDQAGGWHEVTGDIILCKNGLHVCSYRQLEHWVLSDCDIYEAECEGSKVSDGYKSAFQRVRLVRLVSRIRDEKEVYGDLFAPVYTIVTTATTDAGIVTSTINYKLIYNASA